MHSIKLITWQIEDRRLKNKIGGGVFFQEQFDSSDEKHIFKQNTASGWIKTGLFFCLFRGMQPIHHHN